MAVEYNKFYRSRKDRMIAGICGGLGDYFNIDPTLIRLGFVFMALIGLAGPAFLAYIVMLIVVPEAPLAMTTSGGVLDLNTDTQQEKEKENQVETEEEKA